MKLKKQFEKLVQKYIDELIEISGKDEDGDYIFYLDFFKVHRILLGRALFELFEIKTIGPPEKENKTKHKRWLDCDHKSLQSSANFPRSVELSGFEYY
jgi:hypothetical protein